jgi:hypothetical protein
MTIYWNPNDPTDPDSIDVWQGHWPERYFNEYRSDETPLKYI